MTKHRKYTFSLLFSLSMLLSAFAATVPAQAAEETNSSAWGVEYQWTGLSADVEKMTGISILGVLDEVNDAASDAGFNLELAQIATGTSKVYIEQHDESSTEVITLPDDTEHTATTAKITDLTVRHGALFDGILATQWQYDPTDASSASWDVTLTGGVSSLLIINGHYVEYLNADGEVLGADMDLYFELEIGMNTGLDFVVSGGGESIEADIDFDISLGVTVQDAGADWRIGHPSPVYDHVDSSTGVKHIDWDCYNNEGNSKVETNNRHMYNEDTGDWEENPDVFDVMIYDDCGQTTGDYATTISYDFDLSGLPVEEFGLNAEVFEISVSDAYTETGDFDEDMDFHSHWDFQEDRDTLDIVVDDAGSTLTVEEAEGEPFPSAMDRMLGMIVENAMQTEGGDGLFDVLGAELEDIGEEVGEDLGDGDDGDDGDDEYYMHEDPMFECDDGEMIHMWSVNDDWFNCNDESDEFVQKLDVFYHQTSDWVDNRTFVCGSGTVSEVSFELLNDDWNDCEDGSDEQIYDDNWEEVNWFDCHNGDQIWMHQVNDGWDDCEDGEDEGDYVPSDVALIPSLGVHARHLNSESVYTVSWSLFNCDDMSIFSSSSTDIQNGSEHVDELWDDLNDDGEYEVIGLYYSPPEIMLYDLHPGHYCLDYQLYENGALVWTSDYLTSYNHQYGSFVWGEQINHINANDDLGDAYVYVDLDNLKDTENYTIEWTLTSSSGPFNQDGYVPVNKHCNDWGDQEVHCWGNAEAHHDGLEKGEYCFDIALVEDSNPTEHIATEQDCFEVTTTLGAKIRTIAEAFMDVGEDLESMFESFGADLEEIMDDIEGDFVLEDGGGVMLWNNDMKRFVGILIWADSGNGNKIFLGPETSGHDETNDALSSKQISLVYLVGEAAATAQDSAVEEDSISELVDATMHDTTILEELGYDPVTDSSDAANTLEAESEESSDNKADAVNTEGDLLGLPAISLPATLAILTFAAILVGRKQE